MQTIIDSYGYRGALKRLADSLNATNVLSDDYSKEVFNLALTAYGEGYQAKTLENVEHRLQEASVPSYETALRIVANFTAGLAGYDYRYNKHTEYERGQLELLSDLFGIKPDAVDTEGNIELIAKDIRELAKREDIGF